MPACDSGDRAVLVPQARSVKSNRCGADPVVTNTQKEMNVVLVLCALALLVGLLLLREWWKDNRAGGR